MAEIEIVPTLFEFDISDKVDPAQTVSTDIATAAMLFFKQHPLFKWEDSNNGCEARAEAVCLLLDAWGIPNFKAWVFSGAYLKNHVGELKQNWKYHVAPMLQVKGNGSNSYLVIDPATSNNIQNLADWAAAVTAYPHSYHIVKKSHWYIFFDKKITRDNWNSRNRQNRKWMIQGLAGINALTAKGKGELVFNKGRIKNTLNEFEKLKIKSPL